MDPMRPENLPVLYFVVDSIKQLAVFQPQGALRSFHKHQDDSHRGCRGESGGCGAEGGGCAGGQQCAKYVLHSIL